MSCSRQLSVSAFSSRSTSRHSRGMSEKSSCLTRTSLPLTALSAARNSNLKMQTCKPSMSRANTDLVSEDRNSYHVPTPTRIKRTVSTFRTSRLSLLSFLERCPSDACDVLTASVSVNISMGHVLVTVAPCLKARPHPGQFRARSA